MKNFVIIESGSTKSDWAFCIGNQVSFYESHGINPVTSAGFDEQLPAVIVEALKLINDVYFYGAGTNVSAAIHDLNEYFASYISLDTTLYIESDMMAAARACAGEDKAIICILGTGSNSCVYDGYNIVHQVPSLGYLLSDEGSGNHIGKELLKDYFYGKMCHEDVLLFQRKYDISREKLLSHIYDGNRISAYLASFAPFLLESSNALKTKILNKVFNEFIDLRIKMYTNFSNFDIYFVGSIAAVYEEQLTIALLAHGLQIKQIIKNPIQHLILYHKSRETK